MNCQHCYNLDNALTPTQLSVYTGKLICQKCADHEKALPSYPEISKIRELYVVNKQVPPWFPRNPSPGFSHAYQNAFPSTVVLDLENLVLPRLQNLVEYHLGGYWKVGIRTYQDLLYLRDADWERFTNILENRYTPGHVIQVEIEGVQINLDSHGFWSLAFGDEDGVSGRILNSQEETLESLVRDEWVPGITLKED
jgi:hypothetical protein